MSKRRAKSSLSVTVLFASFFGTAMIAIAFAYFNYKFSQYKFVDFSKWILYQKSDLFKPTHPNYTVLFYNSRVNTPKKILPLKQKNHILAIDFAQNKFASDQNITYVTAPTKVLLNIIQRFNIYETPSVFLIKQSKESLYKQDSKISLVN
ncbi:MAG: hypothetical protein OEW60_00170 [Thiovulaceae bacterium]|nr:hypothetical protein [Sulfurimonadaceae bacterium]